MKPPTAPGWSSLYKVGEAIYEHGIRPIVTPGALITGGALGMLPGKIGAAVGGAMMAGGVASAAEAVESGENIAEATIPLAIGAAAIGVGGAAKLKNKYLRQVGSGEDGSHTLASLATEMPWQSRSMEVLQQLKQNTNKNGLLNISDVISVLGKQTRLSKESNLTLIKDILIKERNKGEKFIDPDEFAGKSAMSLATDVYVETVIPGSSYPTKIEAGKRFNRVCVNSELVSELSPMEQEAFKATQTPQEREALRREAVRLFSYPSENPEDPLSVVISINPNFVTSVHKRAIAEGLKSPFADPGGGTKPFEWKMGSPHYDDIPYPVVHFSLGHYKTPAGQSALMIYAIQPARPLTGKFSNRIPGVFSYQENYINIGLRRIAEMARAAGDEFIVWTSGEQQARLLDPTRAEVKRVRGIKMPDKDNKPSYWVTFFDEEAPVGPPQYLVANDEKLGLLVHPDVAEAFRNADFKKAIDVEFKRHDTLKYFLSGTGNVYDRALRKAITEHMHTKNKGIGQIELDLSNLDPGDIDVQKLWKDTERGKITFNAVRVSDFFPDDKTPEAAQQLSKMRYFSTLIPPAVGLAGLSEKAKEREQ